MLGAYGYFELHRTYTFDICCFYQLKYIYMLKNVDKFQDFNLHTISLSKVFLFEDNAYFEFSQVLYI